MGRPNFWWANALLERALIASCSIATSVSIPAKHDKATKSFRSHVYRRAAHLCFLPILMGCASDDNIPKTEIIRLPGETKTVYVYNRPPADALSCLPEVIAPESLSMDGAQDVDAATYEGENRKAGADCRAKIQYLKGWAESLPK